MTVFQVVSWFVLR